MTLLLDMNVSPLWIRALSSGGFDVHHWSDVGKADAPDEEILRYASVHKMTIFTQDLDFGIALARSGAALPSVVQLRSDDVLPEFIAERVLEALNAFRDELAKGFLVTIDPKRTRARVLPINAFLHE